MALNLVALDFDHTVVDDNTDTVVASLIDKNKIPDAVKGLYRRDGWTSYMQGIFNVLYEHNIDESTILDSVRNIKETPGMCNFIKKAQDRLNSHVIIISDSNTIFIETWLKHNKLHDVVTKVYSNPAHFENGLLKIKMYHLQDYCKLSSKNLCKGQILLDFLEEQKSKGIEYNKVIYCGDGSNDFCPILKLRNNDIACVRKDYKCVDLIQKVLNGKEIDNVTYSIKCNICMWRDGDDILNFVSSNLDK